MSEIYEEVRKLLVLKGWEADCAPPDPMDGGLFSHHAHGARVFSLYDALREQVHFEEVAALRKRHDEVLAEEAKMKLPADELLVRFERKEHLDPEKVVPFVELAIKAAQLGGNNLLRPGIVRLFHSIKPLLEEAQFQGRRGVFAVTDEQRARLVVAARTLREKEVVNPQAV